MPSLLFYLLSFLFTHPFALLLKVITALHQQANIEPGFTSLVWQRLEEQNPSFWKVNY